MTEGRALTLVYAAGVLAMLGACFVLDLCNAPGEAFVLAMFAIGWVGVGALSRVLTHYAPTRRQPKRTQ
jgi:hypothetical protein